MNRICSGLVEQSAHIDHPLCAGISLNTLYSATSTLLRAGSCDTQHIFVSCDIFFTDDCIQFSIVSCVCAIEYKMEVVISLLCHYERGWPSLHSQFLKKVVFTYQWLGGGL